MKLIHYWRDTVWVWIAGALSAYAAELAHVFITASDAAQLGKLLPGVRLEKALVTVVTPRAAWELLAAYLVSGLVLSVVLALGVSLVHRWGPTSRFHVASPSVHVGVYVTVILLLRSALLFDRSAPLWLGAVFVASLAVGYFVANQIEKRNLGGAAQASAIVWMVWVNLGVLLVLDGFSGAPAGSTRALTLFAWMFLGFGIVVALGRLPHAAHRFEGRGPTAAAVLFAFVVAFDTVVTVVAVSGSSPLQMVMGMEGGNKVSAMKGGIEELAAELKALEETWRARVESASSGRSRPNIILVVIDTLRADGVGAYNGGRTDTPFLDQLASEGALFENVYSTSPWTLAGHGSLFTGTFPSIHGANYDTLRLNGTVPTLAQLLSWTGYETAAFSTNCWLNHQTNMSAGFDHFVNSCGWKQLARIDGLSQRLLEETLPGRAARLVRSFRSEASEASEGAVPKKVDQDPLNYDWIFSAISSWNPSRQSGPYLLFVNVVDPHAPYEFDPELRPTTIPRRIDVEALRKKVTPPMRYFAGQDHFRPVEVESLRKVYDASVATADRRIEAVFHTLEDRGLLDNAIVVVTSDHGEYLGEYEQFHHFFGVHNPVIRVPLIIKYPRFFEPGTRVKQTAQTVDVLPTILELARVQYEHDGRVLGRSLARTPETVLRPRPVIAEMMENSLGLRRLGRVTEDREILERYSGRKYSVTENGYHYVFNEVDGSGTLYLLDERDSEGEDVTAREPERAQRMHQILMDWLQTSSELANFSKSGPGLDIEELPEDFRRQLEALGYVDPSSDSTAKDKTR